jgi:hypothetical protein
MELSVLMREIGRRGVTQQRLALVLRTRQGKVSEMANSSSQSTWEKHWQIFLRLIAVCRELKIDPARDLIEQRVEEVIQYGIDSTQEIGQITSSLIPKAAGERDKRNPRNPKSSKAKKRRNVR